MNENKKKKALMKSIRFNESEIDLFHFWSENSDILVSEIKSFIQNKIHSKTEYQIVFENPKLSVNDKILILRDMRNKEYSKINSDFNLSNGIMVKSGNKAIEQISELLLKLYESEKIAKQKQIK